MSSAFMLTLVFGVYVSEAMLNRSLDLSLIAKDTTRVYGHKLVFTHSLYRVIIPAYFFGVQLMFVVVV